MALKEQWFSCPEDISIIGIDDHPMSWVLGLTTVAQPVADEAAFAAFLLLDRLQKPDDAGAPGGQLLSTALVDRTTARIAPDYRIIVIAGAGNRGLDLNSEAEALCTGLPVFRPDCSARSVPWLYGVMIPMRYRLAR